MILKFEECILGILRVQRKNKNILKEKMKTYLKDFSGARFNFKITIKLTIVKVLTSWVEQSCEKLKTAEKHLHLQVISTARIWWVQYFPNSKWKLNWTWISKCNLNIRIEEDSLKYSQKGICKFFSHKKHTGIKQWDLYNYGIGPRIEETWEMWGMTGKRKNKDEKYAQTEE